MKGASRYQLIIEDFRVAESYKVFLFLSREFVPAFNFQPMDFNQQLSALNDKIQKLHERTKSKSVSEEVEEIVVMEKKSEQEVKSRLILEQKRENIKIKDLDFPIREMCF